jgi:hypothetical protein
LRKRRRHPAARRSLPTTRRLHAPVDPGSRTIGRGQQRVRASFLYVGSDAMQYTHRVEKNTNSVSSSGCTAATESPASAYNMSAGTLSPTGTVGGRPLSAGGPECRPVTLVCASTTAVTIMMTQAAFSSTSGLRDVEISPPGEAGLLEGGLPPTLRARRGRSWNDKASTWSVTAKL